MPPTPDPSLVHWERLQRLLLGPSCRLLGVAVICSFDTPDITPERFYSSVTSTSDSSLHLFAPVGSARAPRVTLPILFLMVFHATFSLACEMCPWKAAGLDFRWAKAVDYLLKWDPLQGDNLSAAAPLGIKEERLVQQQNPRMNVRPGMSRVPFAFKDSTIHWILRFTLV